MFLSAHVFRFTFQPLRNALTVEILLDGDPLHVVACSSPVAVVECVLRSRDRACLFRNHAGEGMPRLVQVDVAYPGGPRVQFQISHEGVRGELLAGELRIVVSCRVQSGASVLSACSRPAAAK